MRTGVARGIYTNEAGLGSAPIVAAAAQTNSPVRQGIVSMLGVFLTTIIICTMTALVIISSGLLETPVNGVLLDGGLLSNTAFQQSLPGNIGLYIVSHWLGIFSFINHYRLELLWRKMFGILVRRYKTDYHLSRFIYHLYRNRTLSDTGCNLDFGGYYKRFDGIPELGRFASA